MSGALPHLRIVQSNLAGEREGPPLLWESSEAKFSLKVGTVFEDSPVGLDKWLPAVWLLCNSKNGISSHELHRALGVTQKTAWFMLHRIRWAVRTKSFVKMGGPQADPLNAMRPM
jgi:hypothetical protein